MRFRISTSSILAVQWMARKMVAQILHQDLPRLRQQSQQPPNGFRHLFVIPNEGCVAVRLISAALSHPNMRRILSPYDEEMDIVFVEVPLELLERGEDASAVVVRVCLDWPQGREALTYEMGPDVHRLGEYGNSRVFSE
ncbi:MAG: hypothetical protein HYX97_02050 [Chloroflexi bacterium]|nr:hypothetical protein [Chloroflexota bacterium]